MKEETKNKIFFIGVLVIMIGVFTYFGIFYKTCSDKGTCRNGDCSTYNFNSQNCQKMMDEFKEQSVISNSCFPTLEEHIKKNNLTCDYGSRLSVPINNQRTKYKCCRTCYFINESGSDYTKQICKI